MDGAAVVAGGAAAPALRATVLPPIVCCCCRGGTELSLPLLPPVYASESFFAVTNWCFVRTIVFILFIFFHFFSHPNEKAVLSVVRGIGSEERKWEKGRDVIEF